METIRYITSLLTFYMKGEISVDEHFVKFKDPNSILGLIPLGSKKESVPTTQISSTKSNFKLRFFKLIIGIIILVLSISAFSEPDVFILGIILLIIAGNIILNAFEINLDIIMTSGEVRSIDFFIFEKSKAEHAEEIINNIIANRLDDTNVRTQTDRIVDAINKK